MSTSQLDKTGLTIEALSSIISDLTAGMQSIYGPNINVNSNSPDGQFINIMAQELIDLLELVQAVYASFSVNTAYGTQLDNRVAINGIQRVQGTYTQAYVQITATQAVPIYGQNQTAQPVFTVSDSSGNQYQLASTYAFSGAGTQTLLFVAVQIGQVFTTPNTITTIITSTLGITTANNSSTASDIVGINEETDAQLRLRHSRSFQLASTGPSDAVEAAVRGVAGVADAYVAENNTGSPANGVNANSIWVIVNPGTATAAAIAQAIYSKKSPGCGVQGAQSYAVTRPNGSTFTAKWDLAIAQPLYIAFGITWIGQQAMATGDIATALAAALNFKLGQSPNIGQVLQALQVIIPTGIITLTSSQGVSKDNSNWYSVIAPTDYQHYYTVSASNITA